MDSRTTSDQQPHTLTDIEGVKDRERERVKERASETDKRRKNGRQILSNTHLISANVRHLQSYARHSIWQQEKRGNVQRRGIRE